MVICGSPKSRLCGTRETSGLCPTAGGGARMAERTLCGDQRCKDQSHVHSAPVTSCHPQSRPERTRVWHLSQGAPCAQLAVRVRVGKHEAKLEKKQKKVTFFILLPLDFVSVSSSLFTPRRKLSGSSLGWGQLTQGFLSSRGSSAPAPLPASSRALGESLCSIRASALGEDGSHRRGQ